MRWIIICFLFINCSDDMISDALPIQFWDIGESYNSNSECAILHHCFYPKVNGSDTQVIQLSLDGDYSYTVNIVDEGENVLEQLNMTEITDGIFQVEFDLSSYVNQKVKLVISKYILLANNTFDSNLDGWVNNGAGAVDWAWNSGGGTGVAQLQYTEPNTGKDLRKAISISDFSGDLKIALITALTGTFASLDVAVKDSVGGLLFSQTITGTSNTITVPSASLTDASFVDISENAPGSGVAYTWRISVAVILMDYGYVLESDYLDVKESHDCTKLIEYSNESDFDGIVYSDISPRPVFYLRIPAMFFEEDNPQEQEDLVLSNGVIVTLRQEIQEKRLLETGYMPNYMHKKLQKVLMHESITIDGDGWKRRDAYESNPIKKYALKRASVLLTKYNSVLKNTI